ncbi:hypothetical protein RFI_25737 [Reticulomyxa filosa]|uniref:Kinesin motor domain-containing protein n=1 Tax=Reticulomyxa filosa TaxID=46433 RepID=X6MF12_RETFI|nr:hypothetical protein RFI_25737 [Reticulomyxa filosa]|eukprot:ETO11640.1 hypothetical protein RFI_25737 [Reticulomyxa filosa]
MVDAALEGYNVTIFCYGQSGAGKSLTVSTIRATNSLNQYTYTHKKMFGPETFDKERAVDKELDGILPRCIEYLLQCLTERTNMISRTFSATDDDDGEDEQEDGKAPSIIKEWKVYVEFIQIYKRFNGFTRRENRKLIIRQNFQTDTTQVENLSKISITSTQDFDKLLQKAIGNRVVAKHALDTLFALAHVEINNLSLHRGSRLDSRFNDIDKANSKF